MIQRLNLIACEKVYCLSYLSLKDGGRGMKMKKIIMIVVGMGMIGGALADTTTVVQPVSVEVKNVCSYNTPDQTDVNGAPAFKSVSVDLGTYKANADSKTVSTNPRAGDDHTGFLYVFHCTSGTTFTNVVYQGGTSDTNTPGEQNHNGVIVLKDSANHVLNANYDVAFTQYNNTQTTPRGDTNNGDFHYADATFKVPAGQWNAPQGSYTGNLTLVISYN